MDSGSVPGSSDYYNDEEEDTVGVSIAKDKLFEVDVRRWSVSTHGPLRQLVDN